MATILSIERFLPPYRYEQDAVVEWARAWLEEGGLPASILSVFHSAGVSRRASVVPIEEVFRPQDFETQNRRYAEIARTSATDVARRALASAGLAAADIRLVVSVSCTGFMIPAVDAFVADELGLGPNLVRLPITESGCAGGVVALARATDYLAAHPREAALVLAVELSSLTFQRWDRSKANIVSTAIFGDGGAAVVLVGADHPRAAADGLARITDTASLFFPGTTHLMGFILRNAGLQIVLDRALTGFVRREVANVVEAVLVPRGLSRASIAHWVLHPGGRRIVEAMAERLGLQTEDLAPTEAVLSEHGNMSSVTVLFVLDEIIRRHLPQAGAKGLVGAFGPGFGAEFAIVEFTGRAAP